MFQVALNKEIAKKECENDKVDDLKVKEVAGIAVWQDCDDAVTDDDSELDQLNDCYERFDAFDEALNGGVVEGTEEVVSVHCDVDVGVDDCDVNCHQL